jgi:hypothetical protein
LDEATAAGFTTSSEKMLNYNQGGANPKLLYRFLVPVSENVNGVASYYNGVSFTPGVIIEKNGTLVYQNSAVPVAEHRETYTDGIGGTSTKIQSNFGTVIPNTFGSATHTYTTSTGDTAIVNVQAYRRASVFRVRGVITQSTANTLFEFGGVSRGMACYVFNGTLYVQGGSGVSAGGSVEMSYPIGASETITDVTVSLCSASANSGICTLFVNLVKVATATNPTSNNAFGTNAGGIRKKQGDAMCNTRMGTGANSQYIITGGTVTSMDVWGGVSLNNS